jgi:hypothetical protein
MSPDEFGKVGNKSDMQAASDDQIIPIKDRVLYWPTVLAVFWSWLFITYDRTGPGLDFAPLEILLCWLISAGAGVVACISAIIERAWRRLLSAMVLPLSVIVVVFVWWR